MDVLGLITGGIKMMFDALDGKIDNPADAIKGAVEKQVPTTVAGLVNGVPPPGGPGFTPHVPGFGGPGGPGGGVGGC